MAYYFGDPLGSSNLYFNGLAPTTVYSEDPDWNQKRADGEVTFAGSEGWRDTLERAVVLNEQCFQPRSEGTLPAKAFQLLTSGKAVMAPSQASSFGGIAAANPKIQLGAFPLPGSDDASKNRINISPGSYAGSARTTNKDATLALVNFIGENATWYARELGTIGSGQKSGFPKMLSAFEPFFQKARVS